MIDFSKNADNATKTVNAEKVHDVKLKPKTERNIKINYDFEKRDDAETIDKKSDTDDKTSKFNRTFGFINTEQNDDCDMAKE